MSLHRKPTVLAVVGLLAFVGSACSGSSDQADDVSTGSVPVASAGQAGGEGYYTIRGLEPSEVTADQGGVDAGPVDAVTALTHKSGAHYRIVAVDSDGGDVGRFPEGTPTTTFSVDSGISGQVDLDYGNGLMAVAVVSQAPKGSAKALLEELVAALEPVDPEQPLQGLTVKSSEDFSEAGRIAPSATTSVSPGGKLRYREPSGGDVFLEFRQIEGTPSLDLAASPLLTPIELLGDLPVVASEGRGVGGSSKVVTIIGDYEITLSGSASIDRLKELTTLVESVDEKTWFELADTALTVATAGEPTLSLGKAPDGAAVDVWAKDGAPSAVCLSGDSSLRERCGFAASLSPIAVRLPYGARGLVAGCDSEIAGSLSSVRVNGKQTKVVPAPCGQSFISEVEASSPATLQIDTTNEETGSSAFKLDFAAPR